MIAASVALVFVGCRGASNPSLPATAEAELAGAIDDYRAALDAFTSDKSDMTALDQASQEATRLRETILAIGDTDADFTSAPQVIGVEKALTAFSYATVPYRDGPTVVNAAALDESISRARATLSSLVERYAL